MKLDSDLSVIQRIHPEHIWLDLSPELIETAQAIAPKYSNQYAQSQAVLNYLCQLSFQDWLKINYGIQKDELQTSLRDLWEFINGFSIQVKDKILVLIPSDARDTEGFSIEQEWIDIPSLAADFYLPVQVNLEESFLHIWGFISRVDAKKYAFYHRQSRKYLIDRDYLLDNFDIFRECCEFGESEKGAIEPLPALSTEEAIELIQELSQPSPYSPRLNLSFQKWGALLDQEKWVKQLSYARLETRVITLSSWFKNLFPLRYQAIEASTENTPKRLAFLAPITERIIPLSTEDIQATVRQLYASQKEVNYHEELSPQESLAKLQHQTSNETIRWKAAEYLWTIDPHYPNAAIRRKLDIGSQLGASKIALTVGVLATDNGQIAVLLRSHPLEEGTKLPPGLCLRVLDETGEPISGLAATSREKAIDSYIQLYFLADKGDRFTVTLTLGDNSLSEQFKI